MRARLLHNDQQRNPFIRVQTVTTSALIRPASPLLRPAADIVARQLGEFAVVIHLATNGIYELNSTGARIWDLVGNGATVETTLETLAAEFDMAPETVRTEVDDIIKELLDEGLLVAA